MPLYEYECEACKQRFEVIQKFSDPPPETCARCGKGPVLRQLSTRHPSNPLFWRLIGDVEDFYVHDRTASLGT